MMIRTMMRCLRLERRKAAKVEVEVSRGVGEVLRDEWIVGSLRQKRGAGGDSGRTSQLHGVRAERGAWAMKDANIG